MDYDDWWDSLPEEERKKLAYGDRHEMAKAAFKAPPYSRPGSRAQVIKEAYMKAHKLKEPKKG